MAGLLSRKNLEIRISKMDVRIMPKMLGKMSAARMNALEDEVERLRKRVATLEKKVQK